MTKRTEMKKEEKRLGEEIKRKERWKKNERAKLGGGRRKKRENKIASFFPKVFLPLN